MQIEMEVEGSIYNLKESMENAIYHFLDEKATKIKAQEAGLDNRCGHIWITRNFIVAKKGVSGNIDYYGGFEYVGDDERFTVGDYTFYSADDNRVDGHIERYYSNHPDEEEETEDDE